MTTQTELDTEKARAEGARVTFEFLRWLIQYGIVFKECKENAAALHAYLQEKNLDWTLPNVVAAYNEQVQRGHKFIVETLAPPVSVEKEEEPLPEVPGMGEPQIFTLEDVNNMPKERYKKLYFGPHKDQFRARVAEIIRRAKTEQE